MLIKITSHRGDHSATVEDDVACMLYEKLTGKREETIPETIRVKIPDNFSELEALWKDSVMGYIAVEVTPEKDLLPVKQFNPKANEMLFLAPVVGG